MELQPLKIGLDIGTTLINHSAGYILGLLINNEKFFNQYNNITYWQASIRHNPKQVTINELESHLNLIRKIAQKVGMDTQFNVVDFYKQRDIKIQKFNAGKQGIIGAITQIEPNYEFNKFISDIKVPLLNSPIEIKKAFLCGVFDGRSSYDKTAKFISLDFEGEDVGELLCQLFESLGVKYNSNYSRERKQGGKPRKNQIRIKHIPFLTEIGFISPARFAKATINITDDYEIINDSENLAGLKKIKLL